MSGCTPLEDLHIPRGMCISGWEPLRQRMSFSEGVELSLVISTKFTNFFSFFLFLRNHVTEASWRNSLHCLVARSLAGLNWCKPIKSNNSCKCGRLCRMAHVLTESCCLSCYTAKALQTHPKESPFQVSEGKACWAVSQETLSSNLISTVDISMCLAALITRPLIPTLKGI